MSLIYLLMKFILDYAPGFIYDKIVFLILVDLDIIAAVELLRWKRLTR